MLIRSVLVIGGSGRAARLTRHGGLACAETLRHNHL
jgi:hypothetical protein